MAAEIVRRSRSGPAERVIVAYFNFVNRIAQGLGVEVTPEEVQGYRY